MKRGLKNICLSILGFSAAPILTACYGMPYDEYNPQFQSVEGWVVNEKNEPIKNIKVSVNSANEIFDTRTDAEGYFAIALPYATYKANLTATDTDGADNGGEFADKTATISAENFSAVRVVMKNK